MLGRVVLILLQIIGAWFGAQFVAGFIPDGGPVLTLILYAVLFTVFSWIVGLVGAEAIKGINRPQGSSFVISLLLALVGAGILIAPTYVPSLQFTLPAGIRDLYVPLLGAVIGYQLGR